MIGRLNKYCSALSDKDIYVTTTDVLPKQVRDITPSLALSDGKRIYLPALDQKYSDDQAFDIYKRMVVEKVIQINNGRTDASSKEKFDINSYEMPKAANTIFEVLENERYRSQARQEFPGLYTRSADSEHNSFYENFLNVAKHLPRRNAKRIRKTAYRYSNLASENRISNKIIKQYTKKIYDCLDLKKEKEPERNDELQSLLESLLPLMTGNIAVPSEDSFGFLTNLLNNYSDMRQNLIRRALKEFNPPESDVSGQDPDTVRDDKILAEKKLDSLLKKNDIKDIHLRDLTYAMKNQNILDNKSRIDLHFDPKDNLCQETDLRFETDVVSDNKNSFYSESREKYSTVINIMKSRYERLIPQARQEFRGCYSGNDIDLEASINFMADLRTGVLPKENTYIDVKRNERDVYTSILLDCSGSMSGYKIDRAKEALVVFSEVLKSLGDTYSIFSFNSNHPKVFMHKIKSASEIHSKEVESRIGNIHANGNNRDGAAIRYMSDYVMQTPHKTNILMVISDGQPADGCYHNAVSDTRKALLEAKSKGIKTYCLSVDDEHAADYLDKLYGGLAYTICADISKLPECAGRFYEAIAFR